MLSADVVPGWPVAFRGSRAIAAGLVTPDRLRGPRFRRLLPDVYAQARDEPPDLRLRSLAAYRLVEGRGVLAGYSAAAILGADCAPHLNAPAEVIVPGGGQRTHRGLIVHRDRLHAAEITRVGDVQCTTALRTAFDLARGTDPTEAVVAVDRLANRYRFAPDLLLNFTARYRGRRGVAQVPGLLALANPYAGSPMESRLRLLIVGAGLPAPAVQWVVQDPATRTAIWLDLAWPDLMIGIEYEGEPHTEPGQVLRDVSRYTKLVDLGWRTYRYTKFEVYGQRERIIGELTRARRRHAR